MITSPPQLTALMNDLAQSTWTLAAIGALFDSGLADKLREPRTLDELAAETSKLPRARIERILTVLASRGVVVLEAARYQLAPGVAPYVNPGLRKSLMGDCRSSLMQPLGYLDEAGQAAAPVGWTHTEAALLQAQGDASSGFAVGFAMHLVHQLGDLPARLAQPGARFLDVGVGVAALSIGMCQQFPNLQVVGLDVADAPLALARAGIARAGLGERIELRQLPVQELREEAGFDIGWLPTCFVSAAEVPRAIARVRAALRPGGWILIPAINPAAAENARAVWSMVNERWGGPVLQCPEVEALLAEAGFSGARTLPGPSWTALVAAPR